MEDYIHEESDCGFCGEETAAVEMAEDGECYAASWHPCARALLFICETCITFFDEASINLEGDFIVYTAPCDRCGVSCEHPIMYWTMYRNGWWLCQKCIGSRTDAPDEVWDRPAHVRTPPRIDETWSRQAYTYQDVRLRTFQAPHTRTVLFVLEDIRAVCGLPSVGAVCKLLNNEERLEMVWNDGPEPLLLVLEQGLYELLRANYRRVQSDGAMQFIRWLWWETAMEEGDPW